MNISKTIKEQRSKLSLSQEELAEKVYVTRYTISNWENDKSYPDIHSLILLSQIFEMTIDNLIKGDLEVMEQMIEKSDIKVFKKYYVVFYVGLFITLIPFAVITFMILNEIPSALFIPLILITAILFSGTMYCGIKTDLMGKKIWIWVFWNF